MSMARSARDGLNAVLDVTITAGVQITNIMISGGVKSDRPTNPNGRQRRAGSSWASARIDPKRGSSGLQGAGSTPQAARVFESFRWPPDGGSGQSDWPTLT